MKIGVIGKPLSIQYMYLTSCSFALSLQVSEMKVEYYPPNVDIIQQNEIQTDFYIIVSGAVVRLTYHCI